MADKPVYRCVVTDAGAALEAQAKISGVAVSLTHIAVGDGGGTVPDPASSVTALVSEQHRRRLDTLTPDPDNPCILYATTTFPADVGGWWIREIGLYATTDDGPVLFAYGNHAPYHKTLSRDGQATEHTLSVPIITTSEATVTLVIDDSAYVTKRELDAAQNRLLAAQADAAQNTAALAIRTINLELGA